jgi:hypothetical protein
LGLIQINHDAATGHQMFSPVWEEERRFEQLQFLIAVLQKPTCAALIDLDQSEACGGSALWDSINDDLLREK